MDGILDKLRNLKEREEESDASVSSGGISAPSDDSDVSGDESSSDGSSIEKPLDEDRVVGRLRELQESEAKDPSKVDESVCSGGEFESTDSSESDSDGDSQSSDEEGDLPLDQEKVIGKLKNMREKEEGGEELSEGGVETDLIDMSDVEEEGGATDAAPATNVKSSTDVAATTCTTEKPLSKGQLKKKKNREKKEKLAAEAAAAAATGGGGNEEESDDDEDDDALVRAAMQWENDEKVRERDAHARAHTRTHLHLSHPVFLQEKEDLAAAAVAATPQVLSLYVTNLPYECVEEDVEGFFKGNGVVFTSVRLVYNKQDGGSFRGCAFVDVRAEEDFRKMLKLNGAMGPLKKRKVAIKPTKTTSELAVIVREREKKLAAAKQESKKTKDSLGLTGRGKKDTRGKKEWGDKKKEGGETKEEKKEGGGGENARPRGAGGSAQKETTSSSSSSSKKRGRDDGKKDDKPLSKKERAKKAAILAQKRRKI